MSSFVNRWRYYNHSGFVVLLSSPFDLVLPAGNHRDNALKHTLAPKTSESQFSVCSNKIKAFKNLCFILIEVRLTGQSE